MALADFLQISIITGNSSDSSVRINIHNIIESRVRTKESTGKWYVTVTVLPDRTYYMDVPGTPFASKADAITARDTWLDTF